MDIIYFLVSINKISLLAFLVTLGFLGYEIYLLKKNDKTKIKPKIPNFQEDTVIKTEQAQDFSIQPNETVRKSDSPIIIILVIFMFLFGLASLLGFLNIEKEKRTSLTTPTPVTSFITSRGIKVLDNNFKTISEASLSAVKAGDSLIIGVESISGADIDKARIRINSDTWKVNDLTTDFDSRQNIYYINYIVASNQGQLKVEAQLHSQSDGWLGD